jgi:hypothetical protein
MFGILALAGASAGTVSAPGGSYEVTFLRPCVIHGIQFQAGEYRLHLSADKVTISKGKTSVDVPVKVETGEQKFEGNAVRYLEGAGKAVISEIRLGGTRKKLLFE